VHEDSLDQMVALKRHFKNKVSDLIISVGDTPTCSVAEDFEQADEIRPGNFVFYDLTQCKIGSCKPENIAIALACPVVAIHKEWNEILIQGGAIHFAKDYIRDKNGVSHFGQLAENNGDGWGQPIAGAYLRKVSQEHGTVVLPDSLIDNYQVGDVVKILPVHSCHTANVMGGYLTLDGRAVERYRYVSY
jgi:D-serine deaminase-like pyridoxal phosphate-dependent protein